MLWHKNVESFRGEHPESSHYRWPLPRYHAVAGQNVMVLGDDSIALKSDGFLYCTALIFSNSDKKLFGLYHLSWRGEISLQALTLMEILRGAQVRPVQSTNVTQREVLLQDLESRFEFNFLEPINIQTPRKEPYGIVDGTWDFDVLYFPSTQEVRIAKYQPEKLILEYQAFEPPSWVKAHRI